MRREYHRWFSGALGRDMEMLTFAAEGEPRGVPVVVFPTSCGRFYEFEERGMVWAVRRQVEEGGVQLFCVDSVDAESWYNAEVPPRWRIARHMQYERYVMEEVLPLARSRSGGARAITAGCSMGAFHAANLALRQPEAFFGFLAMSGIFNPQRFLGGYYDEDVYFHAPADYLRNLSDGWYLDRYRQSTYVLAAGEHDICRGANEAMAGLMREKGLPVRFDIWGEGAVHDWPVWLRMVEQYL